MNRLISNSIFQPILFAFIIIFFQEQAAQAACSTFSGIIYNGSYGVAQKGQLKSSCNLDKSFVPASIIKIATSLAALSILGPEFRFTTKLYRDSSSNLIVEGVGDPLLVSEEVARIALALKDKGVLRVNTLILDGHRFDLHDSATPGTGISDNPYDAGNGALAVNFNTLGIIVQSGKKGVSSEKQTPYIPLMGELGNFLSPGTHRVNIDGVNPGNGSRALRYVGELFLAIFRKAGIKVGGITVGSLPDNAQAIYIHRSPPLKKILRACLHYSNNFIANQVFLTCGAKKYGYPATWSKGRNALSSYFQTELNLADHDLHMVDGSGLSRENRLTSRAMLQVLAEFKPYSSLLPRKKGHRIKSGTLTGVYNYAGYLEPDNSPFVIMLNQKENYRDVVLQHLNTLKDALNK